MEIVNEGMHGRNLSLPWAGRAVKKNLIQNAGSKKSGQGCE